MELLMVAFVVSEDVQVTVPVTSCVVPSLKVPVALSCSVVPISIAGRGNVIAMDTRDVTVRFAVPLTVPEVAVITTEPCDAPVATPLLEIDAIAELDVLHVTELPRI
jgi:hypothetical protein